MIHTYITETCKTADTHHSARAFRWSTDNLVASQLRRYRSVRHNSYTLYRLVVGYSIQWSSIRYRRIRYYSFWKSIKMFQHSSQKVSVRTTTYIWNIYLASMVLFENQGDDVINVLVKKNTCSQRPILTATVINVYHIDTCASWNDALFHTHRGYPWNTHSPRARFLRQSEQCFVQQVHKYSATTTTSMRLLFVLLITKTWQTDSE